MQLWPRASQRVRPMRVWASPMPLMPMALILCPCTKSIIGWYAWPRHLTPHPSCSYDACWPVRLGKPGCRVLAATARHPRPVRCSLCAACCLGGNSGLHGPLQPLDRCRLGRLNGVHARHQKYHFEFPGLHPGTRQHRLTIAQVFWSSDVIFIETVKRH